MAGDQVLKNCKTEMEKRVKGLEQDLTKLRTGRASINLLDGIKVEYYGTPTPLNQVATLSTPDARSIVIAPFEKSLISAIEKSIMIADIGLQPNNDGNVVRLPIPALTEERRKDLVKQLKKIGEEVKVAIRLVRQEANQELKKDKSITEDENKRLQGDVQKQTDLFTKQVDERVSKKEAEIMKL